MNVVCGPARKAVSCCFWQRCGVIKAGGRRAFSSTTLRRTSPPWKTFSCFSVKLSALGFPTATNSLPAVFALLVVFFFFCFNVVPGVPSYQLTFDQPLCRRIKLKKETSSSSCLPHFEVSPQRDQQLKLVCGLISGWVPT